jgi:hypothetical protein
MQQMQRMQDLRAAVFLALALMCLQSDFERALQRTHQPLNT